MYQYILFDLDGTLTDPREGITKSVQYALARMGIEEPDLTSLEHFIGPPLYDEFRRCYEFDDAQAKQAVAAYRERFSVTGWKENLLLDGVPDMLQSLRSDGKTFAIASSKPKVFVEKILNYFDIAPYFAVISGATLDGSISTKAQVVEQALQLLSVSEKSKAVLVGDRKHDVEGAQSCDIDCVGVTFGFGGFQELQQAGATRIVQNWSQLLHVLDN